MRASALARRAAKIVQQVRLYSSSRPVDPCDPCAPKKATDPCAPKPTADPCAPKPTADPCAPKPTADPCAPKPTADPCAPKPTSDPCAPKPTADPCAPKPTADPCEPKKVDPCAPKPVVDPCAPKVDPCAPKQAIDPCAPKQAADPCAPKPADPCAPKPADPCAPKPADPCAPKPIVDPCAPKVDPSAPKKVDPCAPKPIVDPCAPKPIVDPCAPKKAVDPYAPKPAQDQRAPEPKPVYDPCAQKFRVGPCQPDYPADQFPLKPRSPKVTRLQNGLVVASIENYAPVTRVALAAHAGSRFETGDNLGVTHCLRLASGLSTQKSTGFKITRTLEQAGAEFTCSSTREYMFYKIDCLRNNLDMAIDILNEVTTAPTFKTWELSDLVPHLKLDLAKICSQPNVLVYDLLHQAAFRDTLGHSLYMPEFKVGQFTCEELIHYVKSYYCTGRLALVGIGVDHDEMVEKARKFNPFCAANIANDKAKYYGGEIRQDTGGNLAYAAVAFEGLSQSDKNLMHAACLQHLLGLGPAIKYSAGTCTSLLAQAVAQATSIPFAITSVSANYTDSGLFGFYAVAPAKEMDKVLNAAYKQFNQIAHEGVDETKVARAKKQLKAQIAMDREGSDTLLYDLAEQTMGQTDNILTTQDLFKFIDSINTSDVANVAKKIMEGKPTMAATGNLSKTPYVDSLPC